MRSVAPILAFGLLWSGCSAGFKVASPEDIPRRLGPGAATIVCLDSTRFDARDIEVTGDSISFYLAETDQRGTVAASNIQSLTQLNRLHGALDGVFLGTLSAGGLGLCVGGILYAAYPGKDSGLVFAYTLGYGVMIGGGIGLIVGLIMGHEYRYLPDWNTSTVNGMRELDPSK